jgi:hypothetical protein
MTFKNLIIIKKHIERITGKSVILKCKLVEKSTKDKNYFTKKIKKLKES